MLEPLTTATANDEAERNADIAILPVGSFEQHGAYLPLLTDTVVATAIAREISKTHRVFVLPPITISCSHEHAAWRGTVSISARTLHQVVNDVADSLRASGVPKLVIVGGHGGNYVLSNVVQEYTASHGPGMALFPLTHDWDLARTESGMQSGGHTDMHAGELETSILLDVDPTLVKPGNETADWIADERPHLLTHGMSAYTKTGVIGQPSLGTPEKGRLYLESLARSFSAVIDALTSAD